MTAEEVAIEVRDVTIAYGDFVVQKDLDFEVRRGEVFVILGGSGCGKSSLLKAMIGLTATVPRRGMRAPAAVFAGGTTASARL